MEWDGMVPGVHNVNITVYYRGAKMDSEFFPNFPYVRERLPGCPTTPVNNVENPMVDVIFRKWPVAMGDASLSVPPHHPPPKSCHSLNFLLQTTVT